MSITKQPPRTIKLSGCVQIINDLLAVATITPGQLVERTSAGKWQPHSTGSGWGAKAVALNASMLNKGIDDTYISGDLIEVGVFSPGSTVYMFLASGQNVALGALLESNGDGSLKAGSTKPLYLALEAVNNTSGPSAARIRTEAL